jgi:thiol-disulfide isomerase/thioredoxin
MLQIAFTKGIIMKCSILIIMILFLHTSNLQATTESLPWAGEAVVGEPAPWFSGWTLDNEVFNINKPFQDESVKRLVLVFWATWCKPCKHGLDLLTENQISLLEAGIYIVLVNLGETEERVYEYIGENPQPYPIVLDPFEKSVDAYMDINGTASLPKTALIGPDGKIVAIFGAEDEDYIQRIIDGE